ncbi:MAG: hypothetical protein A2017_12230 [Lentisphaerae bacterium GWF2_44_16]|nr:MAG: hypothetical protein A2017_12230 [Lentisphaerae bacterium GWF2_44_16]
MWAFMASAALFYYTVYDREIYVQLGNRLAWRQGTFPAVRGKIIDKDNLILAWTEKYFDLYLLKKPDGRARREHFYTELKRILGAFTQTGDGEIKLLKKGLQPEKIMELDKLLRVYPELRIVPRFERRCIDYPEVRAFVGKTETKDGRTVGISGVELMYNRELNGTDGLYNVMVDRNENWIKGTWSLKRNATTGHDLLLELSLEEIRKEHADGTDPAEKK